jgi:hypothetical protein
LTHVDSRKCLGRHYFKPSQMHLLESCPRPPLLHFSSLLSSVLTCFRGTLSHMAAQMAFSSPTLPSYQLNTPPPRRKGDFSFPIAAEN